MRFGFLTLPLLFASLAIRPALAATMVQVPGATTKPHSAPKTQSVMSMGKISAIDLNAQKIRINMVDYGFNPRTTRFVGVSGGVLQPAQLKTGDWVHFWIPAGQNPGDPSMEKVELLVNPESGKSKP